MSSILNTIFNIISEVLVIPIFYVLIENGIPKIISAIIAIILSLAVHVLFKSINEKLIDKVTKYRKKLMYLSRFEGIWIQHSEMNKERPYSVARFEYDAEERIFKYYGDAYGLDNSKAHWESSDISKLNDAKPGFKYSGTASITHSNGECNSYKNYGWLTFTTNNMTSQGQLITGEGSVIDYGLGENISISKTELEVRYCTTKDIIDYLGKDSINSMDDIKELFKNLCALSEEA